MSERRRSSDKKLERIDEMIEMEEDPKTRGLLLVLRCIGEEVVTASQEISSHSRILSWKSVIAALMVLQAPIGYVYLSIQDIKAQQSALDHQQGLFRESMDRFNSELRSHVLVFEQFLQDHRKDGR